MTRVVLGADRSMVRVILEHNGQIHDELIQVAARDRSELDVIEPVLEQYKLQWSELQAVGVLSLPHSHTSVRITTTLAAVAGWLYGRPVVHIPVDDVTELSAVALLARPEWADSQG